MDTRAHGQHRDDHEPDNHPLHDSVVRLAAIVGVTVVLPRWVQVRIQTPHPLVIFE
jgi:hypothetical protein